LPDLNRAKLELVNQYIIPIKSLTDGEYDFQFDLGKPFFDEHELLEARDGNIVFFVSLAKKPQLLTLNIRMTGWILIPCDRCLDDISFPVSYEGKIIVKFSEVIEESTDEIWVLHPNDYEIDLKQYFFDCTGLSLPLQKFHPDNPDGTSGCNQEMLKMIGIHSLSDNDNEEIDPRWNKLKDLLNDKL
jgi:uncharacterized metal-binding protein YceD (DUF177 family)